MKKLFDKYASIKVKGFTVCMTESDFGQATAELLVRIKAKKIAKRNAKKNH